MWDISTTWFSAMGASNFLGKTIGAMIRDTQLQLNLSDAFPGGGGTGPSGVAKVLDVLKAHVDNGGMVPALQDIYTNALTDLADFLLAADPWGEDDYSRMQGERRLRLYSKIMDHRGESKPDW